MRGYPEVEQRTEAWHRLRYGKIGGTTAKELTVKSDTLLNKLVAARLEPFELEDGPSTAAMQRGCDLEPNAKAEAEKYLGLEFLEFGWIEHSDYPIMGISPDGLTADKKDGVEIKCPSAAVHVKYLRAGEVPPDYAHQIIQFFSVNPLLERMHFVSFRPECEVPLFVKTVSKYDEINVGTVARPKPVMISANAALKLTLAAALEVEIKKEVESIKF